MENERPASDVTPQEVGDAAVAFMSQLTTAFGVDGATTDLTVDGTDLDVRVTGGELGRYRQAFSLQIDQKLLPALRDRVVGSGHPLPTPTERSVPISGTALFEAWFTAQRVLGAPSGKMPSVVAVAAIGL